MHMTSYSPVRMISVRVEGVPTYYRRWYLVNEGESLKTRCSNGSESFHPDVIGIHAAAVPPSIDVWRSTVNTGRREHD